MKRLIVCCDGTWQDLRSDYPTNVVRMAMAIPPRADDGVEQSLLYDPGVGADEGRRFRGGAFGDGLDANIREAYRFLSLNYCDGDEIYLFGFSRGAYTVRSLAGLIRASSLVQREHLRRIPLAFQLYRDREIGPDHPEARRFREEVGRPDPPQIELLGCWDTVGALGVPDQVPFLPFDDWINARYQFHDCNVSHIVRHALHAVAVDERRSAFDVTPMQRTKRSSAEPVHETWFVGDHGAVGGGSVAKAPLADVSLEWMLSLIAELGCGLRTERALIPGGMHPDPLHGFEPTVGIVGRFGGGLHWRSVDLSAGALHASVTRRWRETRRRSLVPDYEPQNLRRYASQLDAPPPRPST